MSLRSKLRGSHWNKRTNAKIEVLFRPGCHLCDDAETALVEEFGRSSVLPVNILESSELEEEYVFRIPVVLYHGQPVAEGIIGPHEARLIRKKIHRLARFDGPRK